MLLYHLVIAGCDLSRKQHNVHEPYVVAHSFLSCALACLQQDEVSMQSNAACRAMAALLLAYIHAPDLRPAITLTDLRDRH